MEVDLIPLSFFHTLDLALLCIQLLPLPPPCLPPIPFCLITEHLLSPMKTEHDPKAEGTGLQSVVDEGEGADVKRTTQPHAENLVSGPLSDGSSSSTATVTELNQSELSWSSVGAGSQTLRQLNRPGSTPDSGSFSRPDHEQSNASTSTSYNRSGPWSFSSSGSTFTTQSARLIHMDGSVYAAVPISSEVHIIPKCSRDFQWNGDLFLKPHQRRSLGIDHLFTSGNNVSHDGGHPEQRSGHSQQALDANVMVHEIRLDDLETAGILPSWP